MTKMPELVPTLVICEAEDDCAFVRWILDRSGIAGAVIHSVGDWQIKTDSFIAIRNDPVFQGEVTAVVAVFDADDNPDERRKQVLKRLNGLVPNAKVFIYLLPNDQSTGELEDLFLSSVLNQELLGCAAAWIECVKVKGYTDAKYSKLKYQAYAGPIRYTERAIRHARFQDEINIDHPDIQKLAEFLKQCIAKVK